VEGEVGNTITTQMRRMGDTVDWSREYFTMDDKLSKVVTETFVAVRARPDLPRQAPGELGPGAAIGRVRPGSRKRGKRRLAVAHRLPAGRRIGQLVVATTRPETMLGDVAVMVHQDERYAPDRQAGDAAAGGPRDPGDCRRLRGPEFGTGVVKVTPAHDQNDYGWASATSCR
jgi:valyl-tRNA synthetase